MLEQITSRTVGFNKEPWSAFTHFLGFVAAIVGLVFLVVYTAHDVPRLVTMIIYGVSLILLFLASASYHFFDLGEDGNNFLRRLDHAAIFLLIAGTYVPSMVHLLDGTWRIAMLSVVGLCAVLGVLFKLVFYNTAKNAGTAMYVGMGWLVVIPAHKIWPVIPSTSLAWLVAGGLAYTIGAVVYAKEWPDPWPDTFGHHEVWHLFVLAGATFHYFFVWSLIDMKITPFG